jgi:DNA primase
MIDTNGIIGEVYGRKIRDDLRKGTPKHTYLPNEHSGVFNAQALINTDEIILCECIIDALTFWRWGFRHVTCSYGTNGFTDEILQAMIDNKIKRVLIAYDRDEAGNTAAEKLAPVLLENGIDAFRVLLPKNMDVNQYAMQVSPAQKSLALVIRKAEWLGNGKAPERPLELTEINTAPITEAEQAILAEPITKESPQAEINIIDKQATPLPPPAALVDVKTTKTETLITLGDRTYRVRGFDKNSGSDQLKINLMVKRDEAMHLDKLDLYSSKQRQVFINQASSLSD